MTTNSSAQREPVHTAQDRAELERLTREILHLKRIIVTSFHGVGSRLFEIRERGLWAAHGHESFDEYLRDEAQIHPRTASKYIRVARAFDEEVAKRYGPDKLDAVLRYLAATAQEAPPDVAKLTLAIPMKGRRVEHKTVDEASVREIGRAATALNVRRQANALARAPGANEAERIAELVRVKLEKAPLDSTKVVVTLDSQGEPRITLRNIRPKNLAMTCATIVNALWKKK
jgi:hypothetical protein